MKINRPGPNQPTPTTPLDSTSKKSNAAEAGGTKQNKQKSMDAELSKVADHRGKTKSSRISMLSTNPRSHSNPLNSNELKLLIDVAQSGKSKDTPQQVVKLLQSGDLNGAKSEWTEAVEKMKAKGMPFDVNNMINSVLRQAYMESTEELKSLADKLKSMNEAKKDIRDGAGMSDRPEIETSIDDVEKALSLVGDDAQLANIDLQSVMQKQQSTLQTMSSISKMMTDTALTVIRKIG